MSKKNVLSRMGYEKLLAELNELQQNELPSLVEQIKEAKSQGDLSENAEYHAAKEKQSLIQNRIDAIELMIDGVEIIDEVVEVDQSSVVRYGSVVTFITDEGKEHTCTIVGTGEVEIGEVMKISFDSPLGSALEGKRKGDELKVRLSHARQTITIVSIT